MIREAIDAIINKGRSLSEEEAAAVMEEIMTGEATPAQLGAFLATLRAKGETVDEMVGMARVMREKSLHVPYEGNVVDTCGTGGDGAGTFNVSTAAAFVAAACGLTVAKHGNRAVSSSCGSADVLEALGARIDLSPEQVAQCLKEVGIGFMFAPSYHPAMRHAAGPRREIGIRTVFNILGPLTNPAGARYQVIGVGAPGLAEKMAQALSRLGCQRALVMHSADGLDEMSVSAETTVYQVRWGGSLSRTTTSPEQGGLSRWPLASVLGGTPEQNAIAFREVLESRPGPLRDFTLMNAAAILVAADTGAEMYTGVQRAAKAIDSGEALAKLDAFVKLTHSFPEKTS
jgi:anthranilate phosphoribosyltransferase